MTITNKHVSLLVLGAALALGSGCDGEEDPPDTDSGMPMEDGGPGGTEPSCAAYCANVTTNCTGENAQYADEAECMEICTAAGWAAGDDITSIGPASGNTIACRQYHGGDPAATDPDTHCVHAGETGGGACGTPCEAFCSLALGVCTGADAIYANGEECLAACEAFDDSGTPGATSGDTLQCRFYHVGVAIREDMRTLHCPHAAADGGGVCVGGWTFADDDPGDYVRVDRMGMPAVSTALVSDTAGGETTKNDYNDGDPADDAALTFAGELIANLTGLHGALDAELTDMGLTPCSMTPLVPGDLPPCLAQEVADGVSVVSLVVPDDLTLNLSAGSGFPNGRDLDDPVIGVTLSVILLDVDVTRLAGTPPHDPTTLIGTNPDENDVDFLDEFPYFAPAHTP